MSNVIYIARYIDYDSDDVIDCFTNKKQAEACCEYENRTNPSPYFDNPCKVEEYSIDEVDYIALVAELNEQERIAKEEAERAEQEKIRQEELAELARLKAKYEH